MDRFRARLGGPSQCGRGCISNTYASVGNGGKSPPPRALRESTSRSSAPPPAPSATPRPPSSSRPAKPSDRPTESTPEPSCGARLLERGSGAEAVERIVGLVAARAFLKDLQAHAHRCEEDVRTSGAGTVLYPTAAAIANFIDCRLSRMDPPAPPAPLGLDPGGEPA